MEPSSEVSVGLIKHSYYIIYFIFEKFFNSLYLNGWAKVGLNYLNLILGILVYSWVAISFNWSGVGSFKVDRIWPLMKVMNAGMFIIWYLWVISKQCIEFTRIKSMFSFLFSDAN